LIALGVSAQALHHLNYLIAEPIQAAVLYRSIAPAFWCKFHGQNVMRTAVQKFATEVAG
jgi:hypothetical protein